jgi:thiol-disulfide isomerase/thioredoxin
MKPLLIALIAASFSLHAQSSEVRELKVGDTFPDHSFTSLLNYSKTSLRLSDFRGKLVLFDLWSTGCPACINSWPKLLALQKQFSNDIQIVLVNPWENKKTITDIYARRKRVGGVDVTLPTVYNDSLILRLIPAVTVPHIVWIDKQGIIRSVTQGNILNERNLTAALKDNQFNLPQKDFGLGKPIDPTQPLYVNGNPGAAPKTMWQSILTIGDPSIERAQGIGCMKNNCYAQGTNSSITELYQIAYGTRHWYPEDRLMYVPYNRVILEAKDPSRYTYYINGDEINYSNFVNYSLTAPVMDRSQVQKLMQRDLDRYFGLGVRWEKRKVPSYVLKCSDTTAITYRSGPKQLAMTSSEFKVNKMPMIELVNWLEYGTEYVDMPYPILDETGYHGMVGGIALEVDTNNPEQLNKALSKYKFSFTREMREEYFLVLTEK